LKGRCCLKASEVSAQQPLSMVWRATGSRASHSRPKNLFYQSPTILRSNLLRQGFFSLELKTKGFRKKGVKAWKFRTAVDFFH